MIPSISFIGKSLLLTYEEERVLVIGDLHLGYGDALKSTGYMIPVNIIEKTIEDLRELFAFVGTVNKIILLGDVKHAFGYILQGERSEISQLFNFIKPFTSEIIVIKGNHDSILAPLTKEFGLSLVDYYVWNSCAFVHGDKDLPILHEKDSSIWIMGHFHPAVTLKEGAKQETYKCFLDGTYKKKRVLILPSFFSVNEGSDPLDFISHCSWKFDLPNFTAKIVGANLEVYDFGKLKTIYFSS